MSTIKWTIWGMNLPERLCMMDIKEETEMKQHTVKEVALMMDKSEKTIRRMIEANRLKSIMVGKRLFVLLGEDTEGVGTHKEKLAEWEKYFRPKLATTTVDRYKYWLETYFDFSSNVEPEAVQTFLETNTTECYATRYFVYSAIMNFVTWLKDKSLKDALKDCRPSKRGYKPRRSVLTSEEVDRVFKYIETTDHYQTDYQRKLSAAIVALLVYTGLRNSEACGLLLEDLDLNKQEVRVLRKGGKWARVGLNDQAVSHLKDYLGVRPPSEEKQLLLNVIGRPIRVHNVRERLQRFKKHLNIDIYPHALRATFATQSARNGKPLPLIQGALGHSSLTITEIYIRMSEDEVVEAMKTW